MELKDNGQQHGEESTQTTDDIQEFDASDALVAAVAFGGEYKGAVFSAAVEAGQSFAVTMAAYPDFWNDRVKLGYVLFDEKNERAMSLSWEHSMTIKWIEDLIRTESRNYNEFSVRRVVLTRAMVEENTTE